MQSSILRAIIACVVGVLLAQFREESVGWLTVTVGGLFFLSGLFSCIAYFIDKSKIQRANSKAIEEGEEKLQRLPMIPIVGIGSAILGIILAFMHQNFLQWVVYILAAILILGAISQLINLIAASKFARIPLLYWLFPIITLSVGVFILAKRDIEISTQLLIIGWCLIFYGVIELLNTLKIHQMKKAFDKIEENRIVKGTVVSEKEDIEDAIIIENDNKEE